MGIIERKLRDHATMKNLILDAAQNLYLEKGLDFTTIRKIAERIDYSPTTIYSYYPSKDVIFYDMQKLAFERLLKALRSVKIHQQPLDKLRDLGKTYIDFGIQNPRQYDLMFIMHQPMKGIGLLQSCDNFQHTFRFMQSAVRESIAKKMVIYRDPNTASLQLWSFLHGLTSLYLSNRLANYCGCDGQNPDPVYRAWEHYIESISSIKNNSKTHR
jgi:AcrR family transcriptional regulator